VYDALAPKITGDLNSTWDDVCRAGVAAKGGLSADEAAAMSHSELHAALAPKITGDLNSTWDDVCRAGVAAKAGLSTDEVAAMSHSQLHAAVATRPVSAHTMLQPQTKYKREQRGTLPKQQRLASRKLISTLWTRLSLDTPGCLHMGHVGELSTSATSALHIAGRAQVMASHTTYLA
jgi:hypothetical protein